MLVAVFWFIHGLPGFIDDSVTWLSWVQKVNISSVVFPIAIIAGIIVATSEWWWPRAATQFNRKARSSPSLTEAKTPRHEPSSSKIYTQRTPAEICAEFEGRTSLQAETLVKTHIGKWIRLQGKISDISSARDNISVTLTNRQPNICLWFDAKLWQQHLETAISGDSIEAEGKIESIEQYWFFVEDCELIEVTASEDMAGDK